MDKDLSYGITVLYQPHDQDDAAFDLVAIHGLNGHAFDTWTHKQTNTMWLRALLPHDLPNIRVMTYGYNAHFVNFTGHQDLRIIAQKLLSELVDLRKTDKELHRSVVFVCHSLGGIVAKKALLIGCSSEQARVQTSTYGIIFMADFVEKIPKLQIVSLLEMETTSLGFFKRIVVERNPAVLNVPNETVIGQYADHRSIARFFSGEDRTYRPVLSRLVQFSKGIKGMPLVVPCFEHAEYRQALATSSSAEDDDLEPLFLVPFAQCITFHGRERQLSNMEKYFWHSARPTEQLVYTISGLGGCGKTQTALRYAFRNRLRYKSGILFFNSSSTTTLVADFHRFHDILKPGSASNKIESLKQWLSKQKNRHWLMVFDNADDPGAVSLAKYIPAVPWGHVIVTSRDQAIVGVVAPAGETLMPLEENEAVAVLFAKAAVVAPATTDIKEAKTISNLLGYLPLAIDQAGAFMRRRGKSLSGYRLLLEIQRHSVLKSTPNILDNEKSVISVWELNFRQLEKDSIQASQLLPYLPFWSPVTFLRYCCKEDVR